MNCHNLSQQQILMISSKSIKIAPVEVAHMSHRWLETFRPATTQYFYSMVMVLLLNHDIPSQGKLTLAQEESFTTTSSIVK